MPHVRARAAAPQQALHLALMQVVMLRCRWVVVCMGRVLRPSSAEEDINIRTVHRVDIAIPSRLHLFHLWLRRLHRTRCRVWENIITTLVNSCS